MIHTATLTIDCGATTCASEPDKFCRYMGSDMRGMPACWFPFVRGERVPKALWVQPGGAGWTMRSPECLATFTPASAKEQST